MGSLKQKIEKFSQKTQKEETALITWMSLGS
jgi:hypothetical protein